MFSSWEIVFILLKRVKNNNKNVAHLLCFEKRKWGFRFQFRIFSPWGILYDIALGVMFCKDKSQVKNITSLSNIRITKEFFVIVQDIVDFYYHIWKCLYQVRVITVFPVFRLLTAFVCLYTYEF
jgi:hypothetical protein